VDDAEQALEDGASINAQDKTFFGYTALHHAARSKKGADVIRTLFNHPELDYSKESALKTNAIQVALHFGNDAVANAIRELIGKRKEASVVNTSPVMATTSPLTSVTTNDMDGATLAKDGRQQLGGAAIHN
jgi:hypothetical protein